MTENNLVFLKLGGSLITNKTQALTPRLDVIERIASEIYKARQQNPGIQLLLGHGSGSFGHTVASQHNTREGGDSPGYWEGFADVWKAARELNQILIEHLTAAGLKVLAFPPSAGVIARDSKIKNWDIKPIQLALSHGLIPVVQGDVIFDEVLGGTIFSTEQVFSYLYETLKPHRILLAGRDPGVYRDHVQKDAVIPKITPGNIEAVLPSLSGSEALDVTGGMAAKIHWMLNLVQSQPGLQVQVFSGAVVGQIMQALSGAKCGTLVASG